MVVLLIVINYAHLLQKGTVLLSLQPEYLQQQGIVSTAAQLSEMLNAAGAYDKLVTAQWLREHEAMWPTTVIFDGRCLTDMIKEARQQECTSAYRDTVIRYVRTLIPQVSTR
jgi:hypothetical protein